MAFISTGSTDQTSASVTVTDRDEILYENARTLVFRRHLAEDAGSLICKQPIGPKAFVRLRHERRILERLAGVKGVQQPSALSAAASLPPDVIAFDDGDFIPLADAWRGKSLEIPALLALMLQLTDIIAAVHRAGVVHKDISPANILLSGPEHKPLLIDFDLATTFAEERPGFIQPQEIAGTLAYIAPEQTGRTGRSVDQRADLYALGTVFYELAVGHPPFDHNHDDQLQLIHDILARAPKAPAEIDLRLPKALSDILLHLLEKEPDRRYQSAEGLKVDLLRLREILARGESSSFPLGERDFPQRLLPPSRLVGREQEIGLLQAAFDNALHGRGSGLLASGAPGVGKSALINALRPIVTARRGWFVAGKFDQYRQDTVADAVAQALRALIRLMLAEPEAVLAGLRECVLHALGVNAGLLAAALPEFAVSFGVAPEVVTGDPIQTAKRLVQAALGLLRAIASRERPIVIVIDDLQWTTASSLDCIDAILTDDSLRGVLLVGSYRESEVDATHPLSAMLSRWERLGVAPQQLRLSNLPPDDLATLLAEMLRLSPAQASQLAAAVGARTQGNPFDTVELVNALRHDGVLIPGADGWHWDAAAIRRYVGKGEVIDLLAARIARLPAPARALLECMACLSGEVELGLLAVASGLSATELETQLTPSLDDGLLVMEETNNTVRFRHDRVQQAAHGRLDLAARGALSLALARRLAAVPEFESVAAEQYLGAIDAIDDNAERRRVVDLLHATATQARLASNYVIAERCLTAALTLLSAQQTVADISLLISLSTEQHAALYCLGRLDEADTVYQSIERRSDDPQALVEAACVQISSLTNRGLPRQAVDLGLDLLLRLGLVEIPADIGTAITARFDALSRGVAVIDPGRELNRPQVSDSRIIAQAKLLKQTVPPAFFCDPAIFPWLCLESERLWQEYGPCAELLHGIAQLPSILIARRDYRVAHAMRQRVLSLAAAPGYQAEAFLARCTYGIGVDHWFNPLEDSIEQEHRAREELLRAGNLQYACFSYHGLLPATIDCTATLDGAMEDIDTGIAFAERTGNNDATTIFVIYRQLVRALRGETDAPGSFAQASFNEEAYLASVGANPMALAFFHVYRALLAALTADAQGLARHAAAAIPIMAVVPAGFYAITLAYLLQALALAEQIKGAAPDQRAALLVEFDVCREWLASRAQDAPVNFLHLLKWIDAERAWAMDDFRSAIAGFDTALTEVSSRHRPWHRALMTEHAGLCHIAQGMEHTGQALLMEAWRLYQAWGAGAKVKAMTNAYSFLRTVPALRRKGDNSSHGGSHSGSISVDSIDLVGVLRASQALSSETNSARLRLRIAELLQEMTGATHIRGVLWQEELQEWCLPPPLEEGENGKPIPVEEAGQRGMLPLSAFNYVVRTREPLLVGDALHDDRFARDTYFAGVERCSLLGVPVFSQGTLRMVLLLENRFSHGAFTADRLEAVNLIAGQLVISIDNVELYASLERKVAERTDDLKLANQRLEALSSTDPLTGLANRRRFNEMIDAEWRRAIRPQTPIAVAMVDIDQFKFYNDHYGHLGGDECLRRVAQVIGESIRRDSDLVARYGGEEFVIVLPGADLDAIHPVAERARAAVEALQEPHEKSASGIVTISVGIAAIVPTEQNNAEVLIELADAALYRAKKNGRNQVVGGKADKLPTSDEPEVRPLPQKPQEVHAGILGPSAAQALRVLLIEDSTMDTELILRELKRGLVAVQFERVETEAMLNAALDRQAWDIVICDYHLPGFGALPALALIRQRPDYLPFIIVSGVIQEETAVEAMKLGIDDYVLKSNLARLAPAIKRELAANERRREHTIVLQELHERERRFSTLLSNIKLASVMLDCDARITYCNDYLLKLTDWQHEEVIGRNWFELFVPPKLGDMKSVFMALLTDSPRAWYQENEIFTRSGEHRLIRWNNSVLRSSAGDVIGTASIGEDITEQKQAEEKIRRLNWVYAVLSGINTLIVRVQNRDELYRETCRVAVDVGQFASAYIAIHDNDLKQVAIVASSSIDALSLEQSLKVLQIIVDVATPDVSPLHDQLFVQRQAVVLNDVKHDLPPSLRGYSRSLDTRAACILPLVIAERTVGVFVLRARETGFFDAEEMKLLVELAGDIAFALDHLDKTEKLNYLAYYDQLTGLANATLFRERLAQHLNAAQGNQSIALVLLDVEHFKTVNDALGRLAGDALLKQLAGRLADCMGSPAKVAHLGADHFALTLLDAKDADQIARFIENEVQGCIASPFLIADTDFKAAAKIGIALYPDDGSDAETLFKNAEAALKKAKAGGEKYLFYAQHMTERVAERLALENKLRRALEREEFVLYYQPKVALETGRIVGVEALIRWNDPETGLVPPMQFIPLLEETGLILEVGAWALRRAVKDHGRWLELGLDAPRIAVNVSTIQLRQSNFVEVVQKILAKGSAPPGIDLEITESLIMDDVENNIGKLKAIRDMGLVIAIDDFGTGHSSLAYLTRLPVGTVKIDRSFIITMLQDPNTMTLVSTIISLAHSLRLTVVAEGVDREEQAQVLRSLRCDEMQGYLFSKPVPFEEISTLIRTGASR